MALKHEKCTHLPMIRKMSIESIERMSCLRLVNNGNTTTLLGKAVGRQVFLHSWWECKVVQFLTRICQYLPKQTKNAYSLTQHLPLGISSEVTLPKIQNYAHMLIIHCSIVIAKTGNVNVYKKVTE